MAAEDLKEEEEEEEEEAVEEPVQGISRIPIISSTADSVPSRDTFFNETTEIECCVASEAGEASFEGISS